MSNAVAAAVINQIPRLIDSADGSGELGIDRRIEAKLEQSA